MAPQEHDLGLEGQRRIFGGALIPYPTDKTIGIYPSKFSEALDLQYIDCWTGPLVSEVWKRGGEVLGRLNNATRADMRASIAYVPVGEEAVILFSRTHGGIASLTGEVAIAHDIADIFYSGFLFQRRGRQRPHVRPTR